jgi:hypothetical protein
MLCPPAHISAALSAGPLSKLVPLTPVWVEFEPRHKHQNMLNICRASTNEDEPALAVETA